MVRQLWYAPEAKFIPKVARVSGDPWHEGQPDYELVSLDLK
jgi:hypothetical protein